MWYTTNVFSRLKIINNIKLKDINGRVITFSKGEIKRRVVPIYSFVDCYCKNNFQEYKPMSIDISCDINTPNIGQITLKCSYDSFLVDESILRVCLIEVDDVIYG